MSTSDDIPARARDADATRDDLLAAARRRFAADGYERTTIRAVAGDVGVDAALVIRYFGSKEGLFTRAADLDLRLPDLTGVRAGDLSRVLVDRFFAVWEDDGTFLALLRAAATSEVAAEAMRTVFAAQVAPALAAVTDDRAPERAALVGATVLGFALGRYVLRLPPLVDMTRDQAQAWLGPALRHYLLD
ncbi:TetR/AcrR family transcriptional regulator [Klenkia taihuensis]|uniref:Transcriptional regulator, TetR family n=1 Tax=Klenkia taihuensis TaxID=1225127 RepID=A0A1I1Q695_9ACTN|nr:TetR family transcriptional regulator [Klenkia taihuensis]GHE08110.1 TetR family transcriptional regulator [Klenkia taihuensis]SFD17666.1 transcriptional regulator, TetR family [Klenkia taihuensis]